MKSIKERNVPVPVPVSPQICILDHANAKSMLTWFLFAFTMSSVGGHPSDLHACTRTLHRLNSWIVQHGGFVDSRLAQASGIATRTLWTYGRWRRRRLLARRQGLITLWAECSQERFWPDGRRGVLQILRGTLPTLCVCVHLCEGWRLLVVLALSLGKLGSRAEVAAAQDVSSQTDLGRFNRINGTRYS